MISTKKDYRYFLSQDAKHMGINDKSFKSLLKAHFTNPRWRFLKKLRKTEYYASKKSSLIYKILYFISLYDYKHCGLKLGYSIPLHVTGPGLSLPHYGTLVISKLAVIGKNARIHVCVNIGESNGKAPVIGDNVYIGPGVKIFGYVKLGDNVKIGANAVVNKSFDEDNIVLAGVPARIVKRL
jgi:serine O-acetyltransferase